MFLKAILSASPRILVVFRFQSDLRVLNRQLDLAEAILFWPSFRATFVVSYAIFCPPRPTQRLTACTAPRLPLAPGAFFHNEWSPPLPGRSCLRKNRSRIKNISFRGGAPSSPRPAQTRADPAAAGAARRPRASPPRGQDAAPPHLRVGVIVGRVW